MSKMDEIFEELPFDVRRELLAHIDGGTSSEWLAETLTKAGYPVSATTVKRTRRQMREGKE